VKRKKLALSILAAILAALIAVTGTLMLFSYESDAATNVVTLGDIEDGDLEESDDPPDDVPDDEEYDDDDDDEPGDEYEVIPGETIYKRPRLTVGKTPVSVYARVKIEFNDTELIGSENEFTLEELLNSVACVERDENGYPIPLMDGAEELTDPHSGLPLFESTNAISPNWKFGPIQEDPNHPGHQFAYAYYIEYNEGSPDDYQLKTLGPNDPDVSGVDSLSTPDVFETVEIPKTWKALDGFELIINIKGYLIQATYNPQVQAIDEEGNVSYTLASAEAIFAEFDAPPAEE
jgi:hypothetical protein